MRKGQKYIDFIFVGASPEILGRAVELSGYGSRIGIEPFLTFTGKGACSLRNMSLRLKPSFETKFNRSLLPFGYRLGGTSKTPGFLEYEVEPL